MLHVWYENRVKVPWSTWDPDLCNLVKITLIQKVYATPSKNTLTCTRCAAGELRITAREENQERRVRSDISTVQAYFVPSTCSNVLVVGFWKCMPAITEMWMQACSLWFHEDFIIFHCACFIQRNLSFCYLGWLCFLWWTGCFHVPNQMFATACDTAGGFRDSEPQS